MDEIKADSVTAECIARMAPHARIAIPPHRAARAFLFALAAGLLLPALGCVSVPPTTTIELAGAQIPTEYVQAWLSHDPQRRFNPVQTDARYSQHGFSALARGECTLACTDRQPSEEEWKAFGQKHIEGRRVAFYGFGLYVHPQNKLDGIFSGHIKLVMRKNILNWAQLATDDIGFDGPINVYGPRKATAGGEMLGRAANIIVGEPNWVVCDSDEEIVRRVASDPYGLGLASIGLDQRVRYLGIREVRTLPPVLPSIEAIEAEKYTLARVIYLYYITPPSPTVQAACEFLQSDQAGALMRSDGVFPIDPSRVRLPPRKTPPDAPLSDRARVGTNLDTTSRDPDARGEVVIR